MLVAFAVALFGLDLVTTLVGIRAAGPEAEWNGLHRAVIVRYGLVGFGALYLAGATALVVVGARTGALIGIVPVLAIVVVNNAAQLLRLWRSRRARRAVH
jgi:hypothetical protein